VRTEFGGLGWELRVRDEGGGWFADARSVLDPSFASTSRGRMSCERERERVGVKERKTGPP
jgi:hypothetical protein